MKEIAGARIVENREVARATRWLVLESEEDPPFVYAPGHIVALYVPNPGEKWVRHPYTVSWSEGARIGILYRVIRGGRTSPFMATMGPGDTLRVGGRFGEPVSALIAPDARAVVGISTGSGVGPLLGYATSALGAGQHTDRPVTVLAGFREPADVALGGELDALAARFPHFQWRAALSRPGPGWAGLAGRVSAHLGVLGGLGVSAGEAHWHLVGNGAMAVDLRAGLLASGVAPERITAETYHNRGTSPDARVVAGIAAALGPVRGR